MTTQQQGPVVLLSTVTPVYRGEDCLRKLMEALRVLKEELATQGAPIALQESVFVDDDSADGSHAVLVELQAKYAWVKVVQLSRNFGQHSATVAGILHTCGDWVATLDEDLQHPPGDITTLLGHAVRHSGDVVYGSPVDGVHDSAFRDFSSRLYKKFVSLLAGNPHVSRFNSFRVMRGAIARAAAAVSTQETYFDVALCWFTNRIGSVSLRLKDQRYIARGQSGYNVWMLLRHARRMLVTSELKLLRLAGLLGFLILIGSLVMAFYTVLAKFLLPGAIKVPGWTTLVVWILFFGGLGAFLQGVALEYVSIVLHQIQGKPTFLVIDRSSDTSLREWVLKAGPA